jgi:hypothetical protein
MGTKRMDNLKAHNEFKTFVDLGIPTFLMASIGYGVNTIVRANNASIAFATNDDENTRNAISSVQIIEPLVGDNVWIIPRRIYGSDILPLNMIAGLESPIKIDAGTSTWKMELPDGTVHKIVVNSDDIIAEMASVFRFIY